MTNEKSAGAPEAPQDENQIIAERRAKLSRLREGGQAFPNDFRRTHLIEALLDYQRRERRYGGITAAPGHPVAAGR